jgi:hypothetical protein
MRAGHPTHLIRQYFAAYESKNSSALSDALM